MQNNLTRSRRHGRDHKLIAWSLSEDDEENLSKKPPVEDVATPRPQPWMLHILEVNTMNFCSFTACPSEAHDNSIGLNNISDLFVAVPNTLKSEAVGGHLHSQLRLKTKLTVRSTSIPYRLKNDYIPFFQATKTVWS